MAEQLTHRGPDSDGFFEDHLTSLGFRRLSIIDLSSGDQPISNERGSIYVVFNGEIYNFRAIRERLRAAGHEFRTHSDTETIVHAYEEYGVECVQHFRGMFAFAIWDKELRRLFIARDRVGKKPIFYFHGPKSFVFGSELKSLLAHPEVPRELNMEAVNSYLALKYVQSPLSILYKVHKLPPGCWLQYDLVSDQVRIEAYWSLTYTPKNDLVFEDAAQKLRRLLSDAVRLRMMSDVPLGALLSGGVDSSIVVGLMAEHSSLPVKTFSIGFDEENFNELPYAREVARRFSADHHEMVVRPDAVSILDDLVWYLDEPMADLSAVPSYYVAKMARQHVTVVLNGDGGDETFAGYRSYRAVLTYQQYKTLPAWLRQNVVEPALVLAPRNDKGNHPLSRMRRLVEQSQRSLGEQFLRWTTLFDTAQRAALLEEQPIPSFPIYTNCEASIGELDWMMSHDIKNYLPGDLLMKMDRMTMANSLEARSPLLDQEVMQFVARLPESYKYKNGIAKRILKSACEDLLPTSIRRRAKQGFAVPIDAWLRQDNFRQVAHDLIIGETTRQRGLLNYEEVRRLWDEHQSQQTNHGNRLWSLMILELWQRQYLTPANHARSN